MAFNLRVYGILVNEKREVLLSDERRFGREFTKFPGGGLEVGEGIKDCLKREFQEELSLGVEVGELFYLTDFYQESAFNRDDQLISIYYMVSSKDQDAIVTSTIPFDFNEDQIETHRWFSIESIRPEDLTFPIDKIVVKKLRQDKLV
jgi:mutator protein MutT